MSQTAEVTVDVREREIILRLIAAAAFVIFFRSFLVAPLIRSLVKEFRASEQWIGLLTPAYMLGFRRSRRHVCTVHRSNGSRTSPEIFGIGIPGHPIFRIRERRRINDQAASGATVDAGVIVQNPNETRAQEQDRHRET